MMAKVMVMMEKVQEVRIAPGADVARFKFRLRFMLPGMKKSKKLGIRDRC